MPSSSQQGIAASYVFSVLVAHHLSVSSLSSLQENSLGMDGAIYVATALSENHGLHHIK